MSLIDRLAEGHILRALEDGELDNLPGHGEPLQLEDDSMIPPTLRAGYRLLKNAGCLPPELELIREIREVEGLIAHLDLGEEREQACARLRLLKARVEAHGRRLSPLLSQGDYRDRLLAQWDHKA